MKNISNEKISNVLLSSIQCSFEDSQDKFKQGAVVDYQFFSGDFPKIKPHFEKTYNEKFGDGGTSYNPENGAITKTRTGQVVVTEHQKQQLIVKQSSLKAAVEFCDKECTVEHIIMNAEIFYDWVMTGKKPTGSSSNNDLPF